MRQVFLNLPVTDLKRSVTFFKQLAFKFNAQFTATLLSTPRFKDFTKRQICETSTQSEGLFAFDCAGRQEVDEIVQKALVSGGSPAMEPMDHGFMYAWSFCDPDGHHWEVFWMDPATIQGQNT